MAFRSNILESDNWFAGEDKTILIDVKQSDGTTAQAMTGWALSWAVAETRESPALFTLTTASEISIGDGSGTDDRATVTVADTVTDSVPPGTYWHALRRTDAGSEQVLSFGTAVLQDAAGHEPA